MSWADSLDLVNDPGDLGSSSAYQCDIHNRRLQVASFHLEILREFLLIVATDCLSNKKSERLVGPLGEIVTVFVHKYVIMSRPNVTL